MEEKTEIRFGGKMPSWFQMFWVTWGETELAGNCGQAVTVG